MHRAAKLVRDLANQRWISTASADFIFPSAPRPGFRRDERLRRGYRPSAGLRPLNVSRVKCGGLTLSLPLSATMYETYDMPTIRLYERIAEGLISACRKHVVVATRLSPFKVGDNQRPERTMSGAAKTSAYFPLHAQPPTGTKESASPLTTPDMVRSGRVLQTSVKFPIPHNFSSESDKTAPAFHSPPRSATEAALSGLRSGL